jgi:hypothetical protein
VTSQSGENVHLVARIDILLDEPAALSAAVEKLVAFAGAPGVKRKGRHSVNGTGNLGDCEFARRSGS